MSEVLKGRYAIITGANQGLGRAIAQAFVDEGAGVLLCARSPESLQRTREELAHSAITGQSVAAQVADVSKKEDVEKLIAVAMAISPQWHILVNNAGVYGPKGAIETVDWEDWVKAIEINLLGSVLMCRALLPHFKAQGYGKIIQLSGGGATNPLPRISAYAASKAAVVRFAETLAEEVRTHHIDVNSVAPGALKTRLLDEVLAAGPEKVGKIFYDQMIQVKEKGGTPLEIGASLCVFLASPESDGITGKLISAVWDPWGDEAFQNRLRVDRDFATLRRIDESR